LVALAQHRARVRMVKTSANSSTPPSQLLISRLSAIKARLRSGSTFASTYASPASAPLVRPGLPI
jgi:hypothetical protein